MAKSKKQILVPIEASPELVRDTHSKAVINKSKSAYSAFIARKHSDRKLLDEVKTLRQEIAELKALIATVMPSNK